MSFSSSNSALEIIIINIFSFRKTTLRFVLGFHHHQILKFLLIKLKSFFKIFKYYQNVWGISASVINYSRNEIRKTLNEYLIMVCQTLIGL